MQEIAKRNIVMRGYIEVRQSVDEGGDPILNPDGSLNMTAWDTQANSACIEALRALPQSSNPSGTCVCYNLPALDSSSGTFEAELRLYQLSVPTGEFAGIPPENIQVGLSYKGASVSPITSGAGISRVVARQNTNANTDPKLLQSYLFVGQIDKELMGKEIGM